MRPPDDAELLTNYTTLHSEDAFTELVGRHVGLVYSAALRQVREPALAEEVSQAVFLLLARKARTVSRYPSLAGWLCRVAHFVSRDALRAERRRLHREQMAAHLETTPDTDWRHIAPLLDEVVAQLNDRDRNAIVLRFYEQKSLGEVGTALGVDADTAQKRVSRALDKLRKYFAQRGVSSTTTLIAGAISANSVQAAPAGLAGTISTAALAKGAATGASTLTLAKGALKLMAWTKAKSAIVTAVVVLLAAGTTTVTVKEINAHRIYDWQKRWDFSLVDKVPPQVTIRPAPPNRSAAEHNWAMWSGKSLGLGLTVREVMQAINFTDNERLIFAAPVPPEKYDFISNLPQGAFDALKQKIRTQLGLVVRRALVETNALILTIQTPHAPGIKPASDADKKNGSLWKTQKSFTATNLDGLWILVQYLEDYLGTIVVDRTGNPRNLDVALKWDGTPEGLKQALLDQLGLKLSASDKPVPVMMEVVEKAADSPTLAQNIVADIQPDGTVHYQATAEGINRTGGMLTEDFMGGLGNFDRITDASGQPVTATVQTDGFPFSVLTLNQPVPPGGKYSLNVAQTLTNMIQSALEPGVFVYQEQSHPSDDSLTHSLEEYRLPPGAVLMTKQPAELQKTTREGRIVLRIDRMIPPAGDRNTEFRYQLPAATASGK